MSWINVESLNFDDQGFRNVEIIQMYDFVKLRTNVKSREEFEKWRELFCLKTNTCFNSHRLFSVGVKKLFRQKLICHHGVKHKGVKKTFTGCRVFMDATIRIVHSRSDEMMREFPCFVEIQGEHNHSLGSADILSELRVLSTTREVFQNYFEQGMTVSQASQYYLWKNDLHEDLISQANGAINPSFRAIRHMREKFVQAQGGEFKKKPVMDCILHYAQTHPELLLKIEMLNGRPCAVLVTPFMQKVHNELREAGEVVFVDATSCVDRSSSVVIPMLCAGPAGAAPLALIFTTSQDEATLTKGFSMVKESLGDASFFRRGSPQCFMTDNCDAVKNSLKAVWPNARQYLCVFNLLQQVWRWLRNGKHAIKNTDRRELMASVKNLVYASTEEEFKIIMETVQENPLLETYPSFRRYLTDLLKYHKEWAVAFQTGMLQRGPPTNIFCEATICIIKDIMINRCKSFNMSQLVMFMAEIFDMYMQQRLVGVANGRQKVKHINVGNVPLDNVTHCGDGVYTVQSETDQSLKYQVDLIMGTCTCPRGATGAGCKHQVGCAEYSMTVIPQVFIRTSENRTWLASLAVGKEKTPDAGFSKGLGEVMETEVKEENTQYVIPTEDGFAEDFDVTVELIKEDENFVDFEEVPSNNLSQTNDTTVLFNEIKDIVNGIGNDETLKALKRMKKVLRTAKTPNHLNNLLFSIGGQT